MDLPSRVRHSLTDDEIRSIIPGKVKILTYPELPKSNIHSIFDKHGRAVLLFLTEDENTGHWMGILEYPKDKMLEVFDSYGLAPDSSKKWLSDEENDALGQGENRLTSLLMEARRKGWKVRYNPYALQKDGDDVATCGRHVATRLALKDLSLKEFIELISRVSKESGVTPDEFVTIFSESFL